MSTRPRRAAASSSRRARVVPSSSSASSEGGNDDATSSASSPRRFGDSEEEEDSADEWRPPAAAAGAGAGATGKAARASRPQASASASASASGSASPLASDSDSSIEDVAPPAAAAQSKSKTKRKRPSTSTSAATGKATAASRPLKARKRTAGASGAARVAAGEESDEELRAATGAFEAEMEAAELEAAREEARAMWEGVKARKAGAAGGAAGAGTGTSSALAAAPPRGEKHAAVASASASTSARQGDLNVWLGKDAIPMPSTCAAAQIYDRDSLFVGYVYPLLSSSPSSRLRLLEHLARIVHPSLPSSLFPPAFAHLPTARRGASHDMLAWRVLELKAGRDGLGGPGDWGVVEGEEDDGEKGGGRAVGKMLKGLGACDVLVVVSRWYGGTMLGPIRFQHIETCAREALLKHMQDEALIPLRARLSSLDARVGQLRTSLAALSGTGAGSSASQSASQPAAAGAASAAGAAAAYPDLTPEKAARLVAAREKQVGLLEKKLAPLGGGAGGDGDGEGEGEGEAEVPGRGAQKTHQAREGQTAMTTREEREEDLELEELDAAKRALRVLPP